MFEVRQNVEGWPPGSTRSPSATSRGGFVPLLVDGTVLSVAQKCEKGRTASLGAILSLMS